MRDKVKRFISILMTALMLVNLMPVGALADGITSIGYKPEVAASTGNYTVYVYARFDGDPLPGVTLNASQWYTIGYIANVNLPSPGGISWGQYWYYNNNNYCGSTINSTSASGIIGGLVQEYNTSIVIKSDEWISANFKACPGADTYKEGTSEPTWHLDIIVDINKNPPVHNLVFKVNNSNGKQIGTPKKVTGRWTNPLWANKYYAGNPVPETIIDGGRKYQLKTKREGNPNLDTKIYFNEPIKNVEFYYKDMGPVKRNYTVNHYWMGEQNKPIQTETKEADLGSTVTKSPIKIDGYTPVSDVSQSITITEGTNVINFYYYKNVELEANSKTVPYNGQEQSVSGFTGAPEDADFSAITVGAKGTNVGTYTAAFAEGTVGTVDATGKYIVTAATDGQLVITPVTDKVVVTITENSASVTYDGKEHTVTGYKSITADNPLYDVSASVEETPTEAWTAKGTDVGEYPVGIAAGDFKNTNETFTNVEFVVVDGKLEISPVTDKVVVTITENSASVTYDGKEHTVTGYKSITADNELYDVKANVKETPTEAWTAKGTNVGEYPVGIESKDFKNTNANFSNVEFVVVDGKLEITPNTDKVTVTITENPGSVKYDGNEHTVTGYKSMTADNPLYDVSASVEETPTEAWTAKGTNVGEYPVGIESKDFKNTNANFSNVEFVVVDGTLKITPVTDKVVVTITENSASVTYDGKEHTVTGYKNMTADNTLYNVATSVQETPTEAWTAKGTNVGEYPVVIESKDFKNTNANFSNVEFVVVDGKLEITPNTDKVTVTITENSGSVKYDGKEHTVTGYKSMTADNPLYDVSASVEETPTDAWTAKGTNVGEYPVGIAAGDFKNTNETFTNVEFVVVDGTLKITPVTDEVIVTITGLNKTVTYDGEEHSVFGYDATPSNKLYNPKEDMQFEGFDEDMTAKGTDAGTHTMGLTADQFHNKDNGNFTNVTFVVEKDGYVKINPRPVTLTSGSAERVYNGKPLMNETVTVGGDGFAKDEGVTYDFTGSQTDVGESENTFTFEANAGTNKDNYTFEVKFGTLKVTPVTTKVTVTITEKSGTATYDSGDHIVSGYASMTVDNELYDVDASVQETPTAAWTVKGKDAGEYPVGIKADDFKNTNGNFTNVKFVVVDGKLTITPAPITLQAPIAIKTYDGTPLEATQFGHSYVEGVNFADDFASVILTGSQTLVGSSASLITDVIPKEGKKLKNYKFTFLPGTLTVTDGTGDDPVKPENVVTKTHLKTDLGYNRGDKVTFTISVTNIYNEQKEVTLEEQPGVTFVDPQGAAIGTKATKTLEPGEKWEIQATYTITSNDILAGVFRNTVTAIFGNKSWKATDDVTTAELDTTLNVTKTSDVPDGQKAALGQTITYTIKVQNAGNVPYTNVKVEDPLTGLTATIETLAVGETETFTTEYVVTEADVLKGSVLNTATATGDKIKDPKGDEQKEPNGGDEVEIKTFAPITIKPKDVTATYNGAAITGKDVEITSGKLLEGHKLTAAVIGSGVNAGSYELTLDPEKIKIVDANNKDVSEMYARTILPGKLIINKRSVLITSQSATKTYDGSALTRPAVTITGDGFVPGELAKAEATGSITNVGSTPNAIQYTTTGAFNAANYSIALSVGTLTVTEKPKPEPRRTFNLTINYVYQNGKRAAASYNRGGLKNGETFDITSPVIAGYTASETVVSGTIYNRDIKVTVIYTADGVNLDDYGVPLGLGNITMNVGDCFE